MHFTADAPFDVVCLWDTIEHLLDPRAYLERAHDVLADKGYLFLTTGDIGSAMARMRGASWRMIHPPSHLNYFSRETMTRLLDRVGFDVVSIRSVGTHRDVLNVVAPVEPVLEATARAADGRSRPNGCWPGACGPGLLPEPSRHHVRGGEKAGRLMTRLTRAFIWAAQPVVIAVALWLSLGGPARDVREPLSFGDGGLLTLAQARLILDGGLWSVPELDSTSGRDDLVLPRNAHVDHALLRVASLFSRRIPAIVMMWWALMLICGGAACAWGLRRLGVSVAGAWSAGVLFALSPFALSHNLSGVGLMPYLVPFAATAAVLLATGRYNEPGWRGLLLGNVALGLNTPYFAVFGAFFVAVGAIAGFVRTRDRACLRAGALMLGAIVLATTVNLTPNYWKQSSATPAVETRWSPAEAEISGLKIRQLVTPPPDHWLGVFRAWSSADLGARFPDGGDPPGKRLGAIAAVGFLGLIVVLFVPALAGAGTAGESARAASRLTLAMLIVAMTGGLSGVFGLLVTSILRDYSLFTAFLMFYALAFVGVCHRSPDVDQVSGWPFLCGPRS